MVTGSAKSSETHTSSGVAEEIESVLDSAMDSAKSRVKQPRTNRAAAFTVVIVILFGGLTYLFVDWYRRKELRIEAQDVPRLAHVVNELQGWRKVNIISFFIMFLTGAAVMLSAVFYRRFRAEKARRHDGVFWTLSSMSILSGFLFILYSIRRRRRKALRKAMEYAAKHPSRLKHKILAVLLFVVVVGLLWYRRRIHRMHVQKKKAHIEAKRRNQIQEVDVIPQEKILQADTSGNVQKAIPKAQKNYRRHH